MIPKIFDCFPFFNELDILDIRFAELYSVVDKFVIVDAKYTHSREHRPLYFDENKQRYAKYLDKVEYVVVDEFPLGDAWVCERYQRDKILDGLQRVGAKDNDIVIISDADEICSAKILFENKYINEIVCMEQYMHYYYLNCRSHIMHEQTKIAPYKIVKDLTPCGIRYLPFKKTIHNSGWHFSFTGGAEKIITKLESYAHQEYNLPEFKNKQIIEEKISAGKNIFKPENDFYFCSIDDTYPKYVRDNIPELIKRGLIKEVITDIKIKPDLSVTAEISTKGRYDTTLPLAIMSVINQTVKPKELIIFDDDEHRDLRNHPIYAPIFKLLLQKEIMWYYIFGEKKGQTLNHQKAIEMAKTGLIYRLDDDDSAEPDVLEKLVGCFAKDESVGAVGSLIKIPGDNLSDKLCSAQIEDIYSLPHLQWSNFNGIKDVDHLNNSFLFRKSDKYSYDTSLSPAGFREESMFSYRIKRAGYKVLICGDCITWHLKSPTGGIRSFNNPKLWDDDEKIFTKHMQEWGIKPKIYKTIVLDCGLGDHFIFKSVLPEIKAKYKNLIMAICYQGVFDNDPDIRICSIADIKIIENDIEKYNIYKFCAEKNWNKPLGDAFRGMYL